jgi:hypothetical protein
MSIGGFFSNLKEKIKQISGHNSKAVSKRTSTFDEIELSTKNPPDKDEGTQETTMKESKLNINLLNKQLSILEEQIKENEEMNNSSDDSEGSEGDDCKLISLLMS